MRSGLQVSRKQALNGIIFFRKIRFGWMAARSFLLAVWWVAAAVPAFSADDYLSELDAEAARVDITGNENTSGERPGEITATVPTSPEDSTTASRKAFERYLKKHYLGSYGFYRKLPERSRQEVFQEYRKGADIDHLRRKIINRLLQH